MTYGHLSDRTLLSVWERAAAKNAPTRAIDVLEAAFPTLDRASLLALPIGERDKLLLQVQQQSFGQHLEARTDCPRCGERLELVMNIVDLLAMGTNHVSSSQWFPFEWEASVGSFRLPTGDDLIAIADCEDLLSARQYLLERCIRIKQDLHSGANDELSTEVQAKLSEQMTALDPLADIQLAVTCPVCSTFWNTRLDIAAFLWSEICVEAQVILYEVHQVACAYHWRESDILAMSRLRRHHYLELLGERR